MVAAAFSASVRKKSVSWKISVSSECCVWVGSRYCMYDCTGTGRRCVSRNGTSTVALEGAVAWCNVLEGAVVALRWVLQERDIAMEL